MKRRWKWTLTGFLAALALCLCPRFAGAAPHEDMPTVKTFAFSCSGMSVDQMRSYQIGEMKRGRLAAIELYFAYTFVLPVTDAELAAFSALLDDVDTAEKITLINERICGFDEKGQPIAPNEAMKRRFVFLGDKLPQAGDLIHETSPQIRIDMFRPTIEFLLSLMSLKFGYGTKKYSFDASGVVQTATQYIGERQDMMQELNRQRFQAKQYICGIIRAALWFSNTFCGTACDLDEEIRIEFDDSYIEGKTERLEGMRQDALAGLGGVHVRARYLAAKYNLEEDEALAWAQSADEEYAEGSENDFPTAQNILRRR